MRQHLMWVVVVLFVSGLALAQAPGTAKTPLLLKPLGTDPVRFSYRLTNVSSKDVRAYTLAIRLLDKTGADIGSVRKTGIRGLRPGGPDAFKPGEAMDEHLGKFQSSRTVVGYASSLDYVLFADGSSWGPDKLKSSRDIQHLLEGRRATLAGLKEMLNKSGPDAVAAYLNENH